MSEWKTIKLGELYDFKNGVNFNKNQKGDKGILTIDVLNMYSDNHYVDLDNLYRVDKNFSDSYFLKKGDILFVRSSVKREGVGWVSLFLGASEPVVFCGFIIRARPIKSKMVDSDFLIYLLRSRKYREIIINRSKQSTITNISQDNLFDITIDLPPIEEQKRIVEILDKAFEGIAQAEANTRRNLINARELFDSYLNQVFTNYAHHYNFISLNNLTELITKGSSPKWQGINYVEHPGVLFVTSENVGVNELIFEKTKYVEEKFNKKDSKSILKKGDVLTNIVGASIGRTAIFTREETANINQAVCLIRCLPDKLFNQYICYLLNSPYFRKILHENEVNTARANLSLTFFRNLEIPVPTLEEQKNIVNRISKTIQKTQKLETIYQRKLEAIAELKQSILEKAFTGQLSQ
ncbi:hypothetical protein MICAER10613_009830 [Microcystis aeruginosa]